MPWKPSGARRHTRRASTPKRQRRWAKVANSTRRRLLRKGHSKKAADAAAIRSANAALRKKRGRSKR